MRRWILGTAVALLAVVPASGYAQTPSGGDKMMKDDKMKMDKMDKKHKKQDKMMDTKHDKMKGKTMDKKDDKMEKMDKK